MSRGQLLFIAVGAVAVFAVVARADEWSFRPTLHEYIEPPRDGASAVLDPAGGGGSDLFGAEPGSGQNPSAFRRGDKILPKPSADEQPERSEPIHGRGGFGADRDTESRPDYQTGADDTLHYIEVFNPSIVPFKRMTSLDAVRDDYVMTIYDAATVDLPVGGESTPDRDLFWASLMVEFRPGEDVPIPSVAPDMRILSYETTPATVVTFSKDGADNYYVRADEAGASGTYRLVFLADADVRYFAPDVPVGHRVYEIDARQVRPVPASIRAVAQRGMRHIGVHRNMDVHDALHELVRYFRQFEAQQSPPSTGDIYWDLLVSQAGVCRHRSFAFMVTANTLGIPTRFIANEAHAFVESWVPDGAGGRWLRIDLGGSASTLQVSNASDKTMYRPRGEDTFPQPEEYATNYTRLEGDIEGLSDSQIEEARTPMPGEDGTDDAHAGTDPDPGRPSVGPGQKLPELPPSAYVGKLATRIGVADATGEGYRGESIRVTGRLTDELDQGLAGQRVDIYLAPVGYGGDYASLIGRTVSGPDGAYSARVAIPRDLDLGDYEVYAATPGDDTYAPALSNE